MNSGLLGPCELPLEAPSTIGGRYKLESECGVQWPCRGGVGELGSVDKQFWTTTKGDWLN